MAAPRPWWFGALRRARFVLLGLYLVVAAGYLWADPRAGWTWFIVVAGGLLCCLLWWFVARQSFVFTRRPDADGNGTGHG
ncbi:hypothetical protein [Bosea sp. (in: a-proteobacteria)]|uniref:hypothetical protein n=1 Tax=Bosea sp. (in: a-proteobacteria) TaxID=1871050 RepID=UPI0033400B48